MEMFFLGIVTFAFAGAHPFIMLGLTVVVMFIGLGCWLSDKLNISGDAIAVSFLAIIAASLPLGSFLIHWLG